MRLCCALGGQHNTAWRQRAHSTHMHVKIYTSTDTRLLANYGVQPPETRNFKAKLFKMILRCIAN
jgi:hypothetical protein